MAPDQLGSEMCIPPASSSSSSRSRSFSANVFLSSLTASVSSALSKIVPTITGPQRGPAGTRRGAFRHGAGIWGRKDTGGRRDEGRQGSHPPVPQILRGTPLPPRARAQHPNLGARILWVRRSPPQDGDPRCQEGCPRRSPLLVTASQAAPLCPQNGGRRLHPLGPGGPKLPLLTPQHRCPPHQRPLSSSAEVSDRTGGVPPARPLNPGLSINRDVPPDTPPLSWRCPPKPRSPLDFPAAPSLGVPPSLPPLRG